MAGFGSIGHLRVLVVEHEADVDLALIGQRLEAHGVAAHIVGPERGVPIPASLDGFDGFVVLGGRMDPDDDAGAPWLPAVRSLLGEAVRRQVPTLGVCLGAQLLGMTVGGTVRTMPAGPEVGLHLMEPTASAAADPVLRHLPSSGRRALAWHWWEVTDLPEVCYGHPITHLASSSACPVQAFAVGERVWGLQFHLEALGRTARTWGASNPQRLIDIGLDPADLIRSVQCAEPELVASWSPVIDAWIGTLGGSADPAAADAAVTAR